MTTKPPTPEEFIGLTASKQQAQLMLTTGATRLAVSRGQRT